MCLTLLPTPRAAASESDTLLRVGLHYGSGALEEAQLQNVDGAGYRLGTYEENRFIERASVSNTKLKITAEGGTLTVSDTDSGETLYMSGDDRLAIRPNGELTWCKGYKYYGDFVYTADSGKVTVINYVGLEDYVKGVLPYEMSPSWPAEALKAQAVCARSYALSMLNKHEARYGFDLCNGTDCQVYQGANHATADSDRAVYQTRGEYLTYNGEIATGFFFSSDGGATEDAVNVWGNEVGYLKGVADPYEDLDAATNGRWTKTLTAGEVADKLRAAGYEIGTVKSVAVTRRTAMGNVNEVTVTDTSGSSVVIRRSACRSVFGLNSIRYSINGESLPETPSVVPTAPTTSTTYISGSSALGPTPRFAVGALGSLKGSVLGGSYFAASPNGTYTFTGTGWGHNVGMSQYGAKGMAEQGFDYESILRYFFTDIQIED